MSVQDLETAVSQLSKEELARFSQWFEEYVADEWDRQIEKDVLSGRLDAASSAPMNTTRRGAARRFEATSRPGLVLDWPSLDL